MTPEAFLANYSDYLAQWNSARAFSRIPLKMRLPLRACQENILDISVLDMRSDPCSQGFRCQKKPLPGSCTILAPSAKIVRKAKG
jgi:hypothetical protein